MKYKYDENFENEIFEKEQKAARLAARAVERHKRQEWAKARKIADTLGKNYCYGNPNGDWTLVEFSTGEICPEIANLKISIIQKVIEILKETNKFNNEFGWFQANVEGKLFICFVSNEQFIEGEAYLPDGQSSYIKLPIDKAQRWEFLSKKFPTSFESFQIPKTEAAQAALAYLKEEEVI